MTKYNQSFQFVVHFPHFNRHASITPQREKTEGFEEKTFSKAKAQTWKPLNSLTHSGYEQLGRRFNGNIQEPSYSDSDQMIMLNHAKALAFISVHMVSLVSDNPELQKAIDAKVEQDL